MDGNKFHYNKIRIISQQYLLHYQQIKNTLNTYKTPEIIKQESRIVFFPLLLPPPLFETINRRRYGHSP